MEKDNETKVPGDLVSVSIQEDKNVVLLKDEIDSSSVLDELPTAQTIITSDNVRQSYHSCSQFYHTYIKFWIRIPICLSIVMYLYAVSSNIATYQNNRSHHFDLRYWDPETYGSPEGPPQDRVNLILPDLLFAVGYSKSPSLHEFLSTTPLVAVIIVLLILIYVRNTLLIAEFAWMEMLLLGGKGLLQMSTILPDPYGTQEACWNPIYGKWGTWIYTRVSTEFCGDCIWSGHSFHFCLVAIIIDRAISASPCPRYLSLTTFKTIYRVFSVSWAIAFMYGLILIRLHYSVDVFLALFMTLLISTHRPLLNFGVKLLYPDSVNLIAPDVLHPSRKSSIDVSTKSLDASTKSTTQVLETSTDKKVSV